jgi:hypothetical protein
LGKCEGLTDNGGAMRLAHHLTIETKPATSYGSRGHRPCFEKTRIPKPFIKAQRCV